MANHAQAVKRNRQRIKRAERNRFVKSTMRTFVKRVRKALDGKDGAAATTALKTAIPSIDKRAQKGVIPKKRASRLISRLQVAVNRLSGSNA